jgi:hypothetical protein
MPDSLKDTLYIVTALFSTAVLFYVQANFLQTRPTTDSPDSPASFFRLDQIASHRRLANLSYLFSIPFALLFLFTDLKAGDFVDAVKKLFSTYIVSLISDENLQRATTNALEHLPPFLNPLFILGVSLLLFAPYIRAPLLLLRSLILKTTGLESRADRIALESAQDILSEFNFKKAEERLADVFRSRVPLPDTLSGADEKIIIAYQILYFSRNTVPEIGLALAVNKTLENIGVSPINTRLPDLKFWHLAAAATFYLVLCGLYILVVPTAPDWAHHALLGALLQPISLTQAFFRPIEWPNAETVLISIVQRSLSFIMPLAIGMFLYTMHSNTGSNSDTRIQTFGRVFVVQFFSAFIVNLIFEIYFVSQRYLGQLKAVPISLGDVKIWEDIFAPSLAPGVALLTWILCSRLRHKWLAYLILCLIVGSWFYFSQYLYELLAIYTCTGNNCVWRGYYWHQFLLGVFLMFSYFVAALAASDVLLAPIEPGYPQRENAKRHKRLAPST